MEMADDNSSVIVDSDKSPSVSGTEADAESESHLDSSLVTGDIQSDSSSVKSCSLLEQLRSPTPSVLARRRKFKSNPPPKGTKRGKGAGKANPKSIVPSDRVKEYREEHFTVSNHKLF